MLAVSNVDVFYGKVQALRNVSLEVQEAEIVALIGANGAGKTTLINTVSGLVRAASGEAKFLGRRIDRLALHNVVELGIAQVPQGGKAFPDMTVKENLELGAYSRVAWVRKEETLREVYRVFPRLQERAKQLARTLSGGEKQMLAIGRGLMSKPKLLMLDEPSHGLAPLILQEIFRVIESLRKNGITILLVEQNVRQSLELADRAYVMENGRIVLQGKGRELLENDYVRKAYLGL